MKNKLLVMAVALTATPILLSSCDALERGLNVTDRSKIDKELRKNIAANIDENASIYRINMVFTDPFKVFSQAVYVTYTDPGDTEVKTKQIHLDHDSARDWNSVPRELRDRTPDTGMKLSDFDFSVIASNIEQAADILKELEMPFDGMSDYTIDASSGDPADVVHTFELSSKDETNRSVKGGKLETEISYYKMPFISAADGEVYLDIEFDDDED